MLNTLNYYRMKDSFYIIQLGGKYKIGISIRLQVRLGVYKSLPFEYKEIFTIKCTNARKIENDIIEKYKKYNIKGECFDFPDVSEVISYVKSIAQKAA
jgi:hypothetical protein